MGMLRRGGEHRDVCKYRHESYPSYRKVLGAFQPDDRRGAAGNRRAWRTEMLQEEFLYGGCSGGKICGRKSGGSDGAAGEDTV